MPAEDRPALPPVRLPAEDELAREALAAPLLGHALALARWIGPGVPVAADGLPSGGRVREAAARLGLASGPGGPEADTASPEVVDAWCFAVNAGLIDIPDAAGETGDETASPGEALARLEEGKPADVLAAWREGLDGVLADAAAAALDETAEPGDPGDGEPDEFAGDGGLSWERGDAAEALSLLDSALGTLYFFTASHEEIAAGGSVPLPVLATAVLVPEGPEQLTEHDVDEVAALSALLDEQFQVLAGTGLVAYEPGDGALDGGADVLPADDDALGAFGRVRLTALGRYGVRERMRESGIEAPLVGDLRHAEPCELLTALLGQPESTAREEAGLWLEGQDPLAAARRLLDAARGTDEAAPGRRLGCQLALSLLDERAEPAVREVLADRELGGLARVWLAERGARNVPAPSEDTVFWLTIDTIAAQLNAGRDRDDDELRELLTGLTSQHSGFLERAWRSDHPATSAVLEAIGRLHPDRQVAKEARKAAFKARSQG